MEGDVKATLESIERALWALVAIESLEAGKGKYDWSEIEITLQAANRAARRIFGPPKPKRDAA